MDAISLDDTVKFLPTILQEINSNSDVGPYDDDGDTKRYSSFAHEVDGLLSVRMSLEKWRRKGYGN